MKSEASCRFDIRFGTWGRLKRQIPTIVNTKNNIKPKFKIFEYLDEVKSLGRAKGRITPKLTISAHIAYPTSFVDNTGGNTMPSVLYIVSGNKLLSTTI